MQKRRVVAGNLQYDASVQRKPGAARSRHGRTEVLAFLTYRMAYTWVPKG